MGEIDPIYRELAARIEGCEDSKYIPQILAKLANLEQARIVRELPAASSEEIAEKLNMDKETVDKQIQELYEKGLVLYRTKGGLRTVYAVTELKDTTGANPKYDQEYGEEFFDLWRAWFENEAYQWRQKMSIWSGEIPMSRVIPQWKSIKDTPGVLPCDDVRELFRENEETLVVNPCSCARIYRKVTPRSTEEFCFIVGAPAKYNMDRGTGRKITLKEAMDILKEIEEYALVHIGYNEKKLNRLISNSDRNCAIFRFVPSNVREMIAPSRFEATVEAEKCLGNECRKCTEICIFGAAQMKHYTEFDEERAYIDTEKCMGCGNCVVHCPVGVQKMKLVRPPEFIPDEYDGLF
ncbi:MAG TPA: 4Fe-4S binding protein [Dehalococcoidia bacterium]|nr:4Fe-4S binding protein [Dehalococcoidia bacterium]